MTDRQTTVLVLCLPCCRPLRPFCRPLCPSVVLYVVCGVVVLYLFFCLLWHFFVLFGGLSFFSPFALSFGKLVFSLKGGLD